MPTYYQNFFSTQLLKTKDARDALIKVIEHYQAEEDDATEYQDCLSRLKCELEKYILDSDFRFEGVLPGTIGQMLAHAKLVQKDLYRHFFDLSLNHGALFKQAFIDTLELLYEKEQEKDALTGEFDEKILSADSDTFLTVYLEFLSKNNSRYFEYDFDFKELGFEDVESVDELDLFDGLVDILKIAKRRYQTYVVNETTGAAALSRPVIQAENAIFSSGHDINVIYEQMVKLECLFLDKQTEREHKAQVEMALNTFYDKMDEKLADVMVNASSVTELKEKTNMIYAALPHNDSVFAANCLKFKDSIIQSVETEASANNGEDKENQAVPFLVEFYQAESLAKKYDLVNDVPEDLPKDILEHLDDAIIRKAYESCQKLIDQATSYNYFTDPTIDDLRAKPLHEDAMTVEKIFAAIRKRSEAEWAPLYADTDLHVELKNRLTACEQMYQNWQDYLVLRQDEWVVGRGTKAERIALQPVYLKKVFSERHKLPYDNPADLLAKEQQTVQAELLRAQEEAEQRKRIQQAAADASASAFNMLSGPPTILAPAYKRKQRNSGKTETDSAQASVSLLCTEELDLADEPAPHGKKVRLK